MGSRNMYFYLTCGASTGSAEKYAAELCARLGMNFMGLGSVRMPDNYLILYNPSTYDEAQGLLRAAISQVESNARLIQSGNSQHDTNNSLPLMSKAAPLMNKYYIKDKKFRVTDKCIRCSKCQDICPLANISFENGRPKWNGNCSHCVACISICPTNAIEYGRLTEKRRRYYLYPDGTQKK